MRSLFGSVNTSEVSRRQAGFSLVELMVVITIIGILAGIAVPRFQTFRARSQQAEAKSGLNGLFLSMQAFQTNYNQFCVSAANGTCNANAAAAPVAANRAVFFDGIGFRTGGGSTRYAYRLISDVGAWAAIASSNTGINGPNIDFLRINTNKLVCNPYDAVTGRAAAPAWVAANQTQPAAAPLACIQTTAATTDNTFAPNIATTAPADCQLGNVDGTTCMDTP